MAPFGFREPVILVNTQTICETYRLSLLFHFNVWRYVDLGSRARGYQDELTPNRAPCSVHLLPWLAETVGFEGNGHIPACRWPSSYLQDPCIRHLNKSQPSSISIFAVMVKTYNSSKHLIGDPIASHRDSKRQICENDFSPPESVFAPLPRPTLVMSGSTCKKPCQLNR